MGAQSLRQEQVTPPAAPKALKARFFKGKIMVKASDDARPRVARQILEQHLREAKDMIDGWTSVKGPLIVTEGDVKDALFIQAGSRTAESLELICRIAAETPYESVKEMAITRIRFTSGVAPKR